MTLRELQDYHIGLAVYRPDLKSYRKTIERFIEWKKEDLLEWPEKEKGINRYNTGY
jgi:hypothetical protein